MTATLAPLERLEKLRRLAHLSRYAWRCNRPDCDGAPHKLYPRNHARPAQLPPEGDWWAWFVMAGRGFGKTRTAAEFVKQRALSQPGHRVGIVAPTFAIGRDVCMEGESGLVGLDARDPNTGVLPPEYIADEGQGWNRSIGELKLANGSLVKIFSTNVATDAEKIRGFQCHTLWFEEVATQRFGELAWDLATMACRLGNDPRAVITGTPRPTKFIKSLIEDDGIVVVRGSTYDNSTNLAGPFLDRIRKRYEGTNLGQQELYGDLLAGAKGALWKRDDLQHANESPALTRIVVAIDPAGTANATSDATGIVVCGIDDNQRGYVLADLTGKYSPEEWRAKALQAYDDFGADAIVAEVNYGGDMVASTIRGGGRRVPVQQVHATRGKERRASPVAMIYQQHRVWHVGVLSDLEDELCEWVPPGQFDEEGEPIPPSPDSPNRLDACVWGFTALFRLDRPVKSRVRMSMGE
jgi:phage terminase large subunit-like protein